MMSAKSAAGRPFEASAGAAGGDGGIRTLGTRLEYNALARRRLQPLGHVSTPLAYPGPRVWIKRRDGVARSRRQICAIQRPAATARFLRERAPCH